MCSASILLFHSLTAQAGRCREGIKPLLSWWNLPWIVLLSFPFILEPYLKDHHQGQHQRTLFLLFLLVVLQLLSYIEDFNLSVLFHSLVCGSPGFHDHCIKWPHRAHYGWRHSLCRDPELHKMGKGSWTHESNPLCFFTVDVMWPAASSSHCLDFPAIMGCTLSCEPRYPLSFLRWYFQCFIIETEKKLRQAWVSIFLMNYAESQQGERKVHHWSPWTRKSPSPSALIHAC